MRLRFSAQNKEGPALISIAAGFVSGLMFILFLVIFNLLSFTIENEDYRLLLTTSATIIATILAVSFSISILGIQHALGNFAPSLLKHFIRDKATVVSFTILSFSSVICLVGLILPWKVVMASLGLYLLPYSFIVWAYYFYTRSKTTTSISLLEILKNDVRKYVEKDLEKNLQNELLEASKSKYLGQAMSKMNEEQIKTIENSLFHTTNILTPIKDSLRDIIGLIHRSLPSNDYESIEHGLDTVGDIIENYIAVRRDSADDKIIQSLYEQIKSVTLVSIGKKNPYLLKKIVKIYERVATLATTIPLPATVGNYQFTGQAIYYLNEIFYSVGSFGDVDLEIIRSIRNIATSSILHGGDDVLSIFYYSKMINISEQVKHFLFYREIIGAITQIIRFSIDMRANEIRLRLYLEDLTKISIVLIRRLKDGDAYVSLQPMLDTTILDVSPGFPNNCYVMVTGLLNLKRTVDDDDFFSRTLEKHAFDTIPDVIRCVINICNTAVEKKYPWIVRDATKALYKITVTLLEEKYLLQLNFDRVIRELIHSISSLFVGFFKTDEDLDYHLEDEMLDILTGIALQCLKFNKFDLAIHASECLLQLSYHVAEFDEFGYSTTRIAKRIMMVGILSIEKNSDQVTTKVLELINSFDSKLKGIPKEFPPLISIDELKKEIKEYDSMFNLTEISPALILKDIISDYSWSKFKNITS